MRVILLCRNNVTIGAKINTEVTFLAKFFIYLDMTFQIISPKHSNARFNRLRRLLSCLLTKESQVFLKSLIMKPKSRVA